MSYGVELIQFQGNLEIINVDVFQIVICQVVGEGVDVMVEFVIVVVNVDIVIVCVEVLCGMLVVVG